MKLETTSMANNTLSINYSDEKLRILVEEYITQQKSSFTLEGVCSYVLYCAMEDGHSASSGLFESDQLAPTDRKRISGVLENVVSEGRIIAYGESFEKLMN